MYFLTVEEVAKELGTKKQRVYEYIKDHELKATFHGHGWKVYLGDLVEFHHNYNWKDISSDEKYEIAKEIKNVALATSPHNSSRIRKEKTKWIIS